MDAEFVGFTVLSTERLEVSWPKRIVPAPGLESIISVVIALRRYSPLDLMLVRSLPELFQADCVSIETNQPVTLFSQSISKWLLVFEHARPDSQYRDIATLFYKAVKSTNLNSTLISNFTTRSENPLHLVRKPSKA